MPYAFVDEAIRERFATASRDNLGNQLQNPLTPGRAPTTTFDGGVGQPRTVELKVQNGRQVFRVPVLKYDKLGADNETWPAISFAFNDESFGAKIWEPGATRSEETGQHSITNSVGSESCGPNIVTTSPIGDPIWTKYSIQVWAKHDRVAQSLLGTVKSLFPARTFLNIGLTGGGCYQATMIRTEGPLDRGVRTPAMPEGDPGIRFYSWELVYQLNLREDTSLLKEHHPTIHQRYVSVEPLHSLGDADLRTTDTPATGETCI